MSYNASRRPSTAGYSASPDGSHSALGQDEDGTAGLLTRHYTFSYVVAGSRKTCGDTGVSDDVVGVAQLTERR
jgi:hypothetical protein